MNKVMSFCNVLDLVRWSITCFLNKRVWLLLYMHVYFYQTLFVFLFDINFCTLLFLRWYNVLWFNSGEDRVLRVVEHLRVQVCTVDDDTCSE